MITATGNNFGAGTIQLKDYQSEKMVILNGRVPLNPSLVDYQAAMQLEIYVPDLPLPKSTLTAVFQHGNNYEMPFVTALKSWIRDKNTIVIEKPLIFRSPVFNPTLDFLCAYIPKGVRFDIEALQPTTLTIEDSTLENLSITYQQCIITDHWVFLAIQLSGTKAANEGDPFSFRLSGLPSGLSAEIPFFFNSSTYGYDGSFEIPTTLAGDQFSCSGVDRVNYREGYKMETRAFIVR